MMFLYSYIAFSLLTFILFSMQMYLIEKDLKRKYPNAMIEYKRDNKTNIIEKIFSNIINFVICFIPIINVGIFYIVLFKRKEIQEEQFKYLDKYIKEDF